MQLRLRNSLKIVLVLIVLALSACATPAKDLPTPKNDLNANIERLIQEKPCCYMLENFEET